MKVTYIPVINQFDYDSIAGRVIVSTLQSQNIDVQVQTIVYPINREDTWQGFGLYYQQFFDNLKGHRYDKELDKQIDSMEDIVLITVNDIEYKYVIKRILDSGRKVIAGGSTITLTGLDLRHKNLTCVNGYVDLSTDFREIINGKTEITHNEFGTIYECDYRWTSHDLTNFVFNLFCPWMQCIFCNRKNLPKIKFTKDVPAETIYKNFNKVHKGQYMRIVDDYFLFTDKICEVFDNADHLFCEVQTGVKPLTSPDFVRKLNKYIYKVKFGLESMTNFSLKILNKEQDFKMIADMVQNIIEHGDPDKLHIQVFWIVDSPQRTESEVHYNYDRLLNLRQKFIDKGFLFSVYPGFMGFRPEQVDNKHFGFEMYPGDFKVGISRIAQHNKYGLVRYDRNGKKMRSDIDIIDKKILDIIFLDYLDHGYIK